MENTALSNEVMAPRRVVIEHVPAERALAEAAEGVDMQCAVAFRNLSTDASARHCMAQVVDEVTLPSLFALARSSNGAIREHVCVALHNMATR